MYSQIVYSVVAVFAVFIVYDVPGVLSDQCADYETCVNKADERFYDNHCKLSVEWQKCETTHNVETCQGAYYDEVIDTVRQKIKEQEQLCIMEDLCADFEKCVNESNHRFPESYCELSVEYQKCETTYNFETCQGAYYDNIRKKIKEDKQQCIMAEVPGVLRDHCADYETCVNEAYARSYDSHCKLSVKWQKCETTHNVETCQGSYYDDVLDSVRLKIKQQQELCILEDVPAVLRDHCADYEKCVNEADTLYDGHCELSNAWKKCDKTHNIRTCEGEFYDTVRKRLKEEEELCIIQDVPAVLSDHCADYETCVKEADTLYDGHCELSNAWKKCDKTHDIRTCEGEFYDTVRKRLKEEEQLCIIQEISEIERRSMT